MSGFLPREGTRTLKIVRFIAAHADGLSANEIERFIVNDMGKQWVPSKGAGAWKNSLYGENGIFRKYCVKVGDRWHISKDAGFHLERAQKPDSAPRGNLDRQQLAKQIGLAPFTRRLEDVNVDEIRDLTVMNQPDRGIKIETDSGRASKPEVLSNYIGIPAEQLKKMRQHMAIEPSLIRHLSDLKVLQLSEKNARAEKLRVRARINELNLELKPLEKKSNELTEQITKLKSDILDVFNRIRDELGVEQ